MTARKTYLTASGVLVESRGRFMDRHPRHGRDWKVIAYRVGSGGFHGAIWLKNLREVKRAKGKR